MQCSRLISEGMSARKTNPLPRTIRAPVSLVLSTIIRELREAHGWTTTELAEKSHLTRQGIERLEKREGSILSETIEHIAEAFEMTYSQLVAIGEQRVANWLPECRVCNYSCFENGALKHLDTARGCQRPRH